LRQVHLSPDVYFSAGRFYVYKLFIIEPGLNPVGRNAQTNTIPFFVLKRDKLRCLVVSGVIVVNIRQAADAAAPSAEDKRAGIVGDGKGQ